MTTQYQVSSLDTFYTFANHKFKNPDDVSVIFDIGSLHCLESIEFSKKYKNAKIFAFEANPDSYQVCLENTKDIDNIVVINKAINSYNGTCVFYPIDPEKTVSPWFDGNRGASSLYKANGSYDHIEKYVQKEIEVECIRLDSFCQKNNIVNIDLMWMDLQGAELTALQSLGDELLTTVQVIHTELEINPMYENQCLFSDVNLFLSQSNFYRASGRTDVQFGTDFIFVNKNK
jgi:FkbM family methyltransferase